MNLPKHHEIATVESNTFIYLVQLTRHHPN